MSVLDQEPISAAQAIDAWVEICWRIQRRRARHCTAEVTAGDGFEAALFEEIVEDVTRRRAAELLERDRGAGS